MNKNKMDRLDILIVGVGGQGTLLASVLLGNLAMNAEYDVKLSEVHGMAQRGGSVVTHVRMDKAGVHVPTIDKGMADIIIAFERLEGYRWVSHLKKDGVLYSNTGRINPMPVVQGAVAYPQEIEAFYEAHSVDARFIRAQDIAAELGNARVVNTVMLGAAAADMPFAVEDWIGEIEASIRPAFKEVNKAAFMCGYEIGNQA